ncbi:3-oxoacyl-ACP synthase III family protein [Nitrospira sp. NS4]|uniref:3-oxoacyl-ACP synthase III family protein n=1 Tax=Nitrospira sp. NS4 TaxID=3414498 RepID=UPI003C2D7419
MKSLRVIGTGSSLPERVVGNSEVAAPLGISAEQIERLTGIRERRWAAEGQASSDLALDASRKALDAAGCQASSVDAVILSTTSPDMAFPSTACFVQRGLGCRGVGAFDVSASCSGFLYGLSMADAMVRSGQVTTCLVVAAEVKSRFLDPADEATAVLFGDGAGAVVVRGEDDGTAKRRGLLGIRLHADGSKHDLIRVPAGGSRRPASAETVLKNEHVLRMRGASLFRIAVRRVEQAVQDILKEFGIGIEEIGQVVLHQANGRILSQVAGRLGVPAERLTSVIERYGNTSSASLPIAMDAAVRDGKIVSGDLVLLGSFGGGLTWATGLVRW